MRHSPNRFGYLSLDVHILVISFVLFSIASVYLLLFWLKFVSFLRSIQLRFLMFEINPILNKVKDLTERSELLRGYL